MRKQIDRRAQRLRRAFAIVMMVSGLVLMGGFLAPSMAAGGDNDTTSPQATTAATTAADGSADASAAKPTAESDDPPADKGDGDDSSDDEDPGDPGPLCALGDADDNVAGCQNVSCFTAGNELAGLPGRRNCPAGSPGSKLIGGVSFTPVVGGGGDNGGGDNGGGDNGGGDNGGGDNGGGDNGGGDNGGGDNGGGDNGGGGNTSSGNGGVGGSVSSGTGTGNAGSFLGQGAAPEGTVNAQADSADTGISACGSSVVCQSSAPTDTTPSSAANGVLPDTGARSGSLPLGIAGLLLVLLGAVLAARSQRHVGAHRG